MNTARQLAADAGWEAVNAAVRTFGGYGLGTEYDAEGQFRETRLYREAPISKNLIFSCPAGHDIGLPRSV